MKFYNLVWTCPYYKRHEKLKVEGDCGTVLFKDVEQTREYVSSFCASHGWQDCTIAKSMNGYFERLEDERKVKSKKQKIRNHRPSEKAGSNKG